DLKAGLNPQSLQSIGFMQGLGSVHDKVKREEKIGRYLAAMYGIDEAKCSEAINLAKADLTTEMVDEFGKLQGLMGYYYAKALGKDSGVALAIKEQYLPLGEKSALPSSQLAAVVAMANKLDTLMGLFSIGKIPTGSKDPFALRRAVNGIIAIVLEYRFAFDIKSVISQLSTHYEGFDQQKLEQFIIERIYKSFDYNRSLITAVLGSGERDIVRIDKKLRALDAIVQSSGFAEVMATFKRVANISKDVNLQALTVDENLFEQPQEKQLFAAFAGVQNQEYETYEQRLDALFGLKDKLDAYFDNVMVNAKSEAVKTNRQNTIGSIYAAFKNIADIKEISV
ncbi:MAG: glycine--tRNA ligase subunit beta, partial [Campylobacterota bacterium]